MNDYAMSKDALFMKRKNVTIWYDDQRKNPLQRQSIEVLRKFERKCLRQKDIEDKESETYKWHRMIWTVGKAEAKEVIFKLNIVSPYS